MKLTRRIGLKELDELCKTGKMNQKGNKLIRVNNKDGDITLQLCIHRHRLDWEEDFHGDYMYIVKGYSLQDVVKCSYKEHVGTPKQILEVLQKS